MGRRRKSGPLFGVEAARYTGPKSVTRAQFEAAHRAKNPPIKTSTQSMDEICARMTAEIAAGKKE